MNNKFQSSCHNSKWQVRKQQIPKEEPSSHRLEIRTLLVLWHNYNLELLKVVAKFKIMVMMKICLMKRAARTPTIQIIKANL